MPPKGLFLLFLTGLPLGEVLLGVRETSGDRTILDGGRLFCACAMDLTGCCHGRNAG